MEEDLKGYLEWITQAGSSSNFVTVHYLGVYKTLYTGISFPTKLLSSVFYLWKCNHWDVGFATGEFAGSTIYQSHHHVSTLNKFYTHVRAHLV